MKQPHEDVTGTDRSDNDLLSLDERAIAHRDALIAMARHLRSACGVGRPAPIVERMGQRLRSPQIGDLVVESTTAMHFRGDPDNRLKGFGYLVERRMEWWQTDEAWEADKAAEGWSDDEERMTDEAWYIQYGPGPKDICRWVNCDFVVIPTDPREFDVPFHAQSGSGVTITRTSLLGALADSGFDLRGDADG